jgi:hypothetical protein
MELTSQRISMAFDILAGSPLLETAAREETSFRGRSSVRIIESHANAHVDLESTEASQLGDGFDRSSGRIWWFSVVSAGQ